MNNFVLEKISEIEMSQIRGGKAEGRWLYINGQWYWIGPYSLGEDEE